MVPTSLQNRWAVNSCFKWVRVRGWVLVPALATLGFSRQRRVTSEPASFSDKLDSLGT